MPSLLSPQELVVLQEQTNYLNRDIPVGGSWVVTIDNGNGLFDDYILIYHSPSVGYVANDISDLSSSLVQQLIANSQQSTTGNSMWYYLPQSVDQVISEDTEAVINAAKAAGQYGMDLATTAANALSDAANKAFNATLSAITPALIVVGLAALFLIYREFK